MNETYYKTVMIEAGKRGIPHEVTSEMFGLGERDAYDIREDEKIEVDSSLMEILWDNDDYLVYCSFTDKPEDIQLHCFIKTKWKLSMKKRILNDLKTLPKDKNYFVWGQTEKSTKFLKSLGVFKLFNEYENTYILELT